MLIIASTVITFITTNSVISGFTTQLKFVVIPYPAKRIER